MAKSHPFEAPASEPLVVTHAEYQAIRDLEKECSAAGAPNPKRWQEGLKEILKERCPKNFMFNSYQLQVDPEAKSPAAKQKGKPAATGSPVEMQAPTFPVNKPAPDMAKSCLTFLAALHLLSEEAAASLRNYLDERTEVDEESHRVLTTTESFLISQGRGAQVLHRALSLSVKDMNRAPSP